MRRLGVTEAQLQTCPQITGILRQSYGGLPTVMQAMRFSEDEHIAKFFQKYDEIPLGDAMRLPWEAVMLAAGVDPTYLLGAVMLAVQNHSANTVKMIALSNHSRVMRKRIAYAQLPGGHRDRDALDTILGALPSPKGPTFIGSLTINKPKAELEEGEEHESDVDHLFPSSGDIQTRLIELRQRRLAEKT